MRNIDKYKDELLLNTIAYAVAVDKQTKEIKPCNGIECHNCLFDNPTGCDEPKLKWLQEKYEEPEVDWSKVAVDTPIYVRNNEKVDWTPRYFAKYENGKVYTWCNGQTSYTTDYEENYSGWFHAKLAEVEHEDD